MVALYCPYVHNESHNNTNNNNNNNNNSNNNNSHNSASKGRLYVANAGDSRAVLCRTGGIAYALSEDHKPAQDRETHRIYAAGGFVNEVVGWMGEPEFVFV